MVSNLLKIILVFELALGAAMATASDRGNGHEGRLARFNSPHEGSRVRTLRDGPDFPEMIVIPSGELMMGSPTDEASRRADEGPRHVVRIGYALAVGKYPVTVAQFARFVTDTHYDAGSTCKTYEGGAWDDHRAGRNWRNPGFSQSNNDPVVCMNFSDAQAYTAWISKKTHRVYRLLSEAEYEYVNRAGTVTPWWWGSDIASNRANCTACGNPVRHDGTIPVGSFAPNAFGLYDTTGNAWSWVADCWQNGYEGAPTDGSAYVGGVCNKHMQRGGAWFYVPGSLRSAIRGSDATELRNYHNGFRIARTL